MKEPKVGVGAFLLNEKKELLLVLRKQPPEAGYWSLPGGRLEYNEKIVDAIRREIYEEVGLKILPTSLLCVVDHIISSEDAHWVAVIYRADIISGILENREPEKIQQIEWFSLINLPTNLTITTIKAIETLKH